MAERASDHHRAQALRAQRLGNRALEHAGSEREAAERCERLMRQETDQLLIDLHGRTAALHRQALRVYEEAAEFQHLHAEHERRAAERADATGGVDRDRSRRDASADERDHLADLRDEAADRRERRADERELLQDERDSRQDERERQYGEVTGHPPFRSEAAAAARAALRREEEKLAREDARLTRGDDHARRDQAAIDRESAATQRREPPSPAR
jgi:hypothetical protein